MSSLKYFLQKQFKESIGLAEAYASDLDGNRLAERELCARIYQQARAFLAKESSHRWVIVSGLRGVGKTTILHQILLRIRKELKLTGHTNQQIIYISVDDIVYNLNSNLVQLIVALEGLVDLRDYSRQFFLFLDEVQVDLRWARVLKTVFDRYPNIFLICSGSSTIDLQINADVAGRRASIEKLHPLSFAEFQALKSSAIEVDYDLKDKILKALYGSRDAPAAYRKLCSLQTEVNREWVKYDRRQLGKYLETGGLTSLINLGDRQLVAKNIQAVIGKIITHDIATINPLKGEAVVMLQKLLPLLAVGDVVSHNKIFQLLEIKREALNSIINNLIQAAILIPVPPTGNQFTRQRNPSKYLFMSPALRLHYLEVAGLEQSRTLQQGLLLEDLAGLHYIKEFVDDHRGFLGYPYAKQSDKVCDFILATYHDEIAIEFGWGRKTHRQVLETMRKIKCRYGLTFANVSKPEISSNKQAVLVPLDYFWLI